jgi:deoxyribose-phosphate aldolase
VIGFPLGATLSNVKAYEAQQVIAAGATEVDMVINLGALHAAQYHQVYDDILAVVKVAHAAGALCKVIIETSMLSDKQKVVASLIARLAGADFVKTSTGFGGGGATVPDIALMRYVVGPKMGVKASGGVRSYETARAMVEAGATRIGASAGVQIVQESRDGASAAPVTDQPY